MNQHGWESNRALAIGIGGGLGWFMMLNVWGIIWRMQKKIIRWTEAAAQGGEMPAEAAKLARLTFLTLAGEFLAVVSHAVLHGRSQPLHYFRGELVLAGKPYHKCGYENDEQEGCAGGCPRVKGPAHRAAGEPRTRQPRRESGRARKGMRSAHSERRSRCSNWPFRAGAESTSPRNQQRIALPIPASAPSQRRMGEVIPFAR